MHCENYYYIRQRQVKLMSKKILLITPPYHAGVVEAAGRWPHLGFIYVAGHVRAAGHQVELYDAMTKDIP